MRGLIITSLLVIFCIEAQAQRLPEMPSKSQQKNQSRERVISTEAGSDTIPLRQMDGTILHILGTGGPFESYTETIDGYTIVIAKDGFYYYAVSVKSGDLMPSDVRAKDPKDRSKKEVKKLTSLEKHLRYTGEKLQEITAKQKEFYKDYNLEIERGK